MAAATELLAWALAGENASPARGDLARAAASTWLGLQQTKSGDAEKQGERSQNGNSSTCAPTSRKPRASAATSAEPLRAGEVWRANSSKL